MIGCINHTTLFNDCKRPKTKVKYFVLVFLTESLIPTHPPSSHPQLTVKFKYNDFTLIGNNIQKLHHDNEQ